MSKKYFLSICAIVRNETPYIAEWIEFHRLQDVEHFYIYHNVSFKTAGDHDIATTDQLFPYVWKQLVTYLNWNQLPGQMPAYQDCLENYGKESEWIAFLDVDEFLWSSQYVGYDWKTGTTYQCASDILHRYFYDKDTAVVAPRWLLFGSNGHKEKTDGLVIERFTKRSKDVNKHCKSIVRPELCLHVGKNPHTFKVREGGLIRDEKGNSLPEEYAVLDGGSADILRINHYYCKSYAEYCERRKNPTPDTGKFVENQDEAFKAHDCNEIEDTRVRDLYAAKIKEKLNESTKTLE